MIISVSMDQALNIISGKERVELKCKVSGDDITVAYWIGLNGSLPNKSNHSSFNGNEVHMTITNIHPHDSDDFQCVVHSPWGVAQSKNVSVKIVAAPPRLTHQPTNKTANALESVTFNCKAEGFLVKYEWRYLNDNGSHVVVGHNSTLTLNGVTPPQQGQYRCVPITEGNRRAFSRIVTLTVNGKWLI